MLSQPDWRSIRCSVRMYAFECNGLIPVERDCRLAECRQEVTELIIFLQTEPGVPEHVQTPVLIGEGVSEVYNPFGEGVAQDLLIGVGRQHREAIGAYEPGKVLIGIIGVLRILVT